MRLLLVTLLVAAPSWAEPDARALYQSGDAHFKRSEWDPAIADFQRAYELSKAPGLLFNLAQAHRLKGDCGGALRLYREYLRLDPTGKMRAKAAQHAREME